MFQFIWAWEDTHMCLEAWFTSYSKESFDTENIAEKIQVLRQKNSVYVFIPLLAMHDLMEGPAETPARHDTEILIVMSKIWGPKSLV